MLWAMSRPECCGTWMKRYGRRKGRQRWKCRSTCGRTMTESAGGPARRPPARRSLLFGECQPWVVDGPVGYPIREDDRGRARVQLGKGHEYANTGGWNWLCRVLVQWSLGRVLGRLEHVHHVNGNRSDDRLENYEVMAADSHGRHHYGRGVRDVAVIAAWDEEKGALVEFHEPVAV